MKKLQKTGWVGSYIQTSIVISAKDLKLLGGVFHKISFCKDVIRVIYKIRGKCCKKRKEGGVSYRIQVSLQQKRYKIIVWSFIQNIPAHIF